MTELFSLDMVMGSRRGRRKRRPRNKQRNRNRKKSKRRRRKKWWVDDCFCHVY